MVPTFTTSNERMLLLLADGASGMLRVEDAERLQVGGLLCLGMVQGMRLSSAASISRGVAVVRRPARPCTSV